VALDKLKRKAEDHKRDYITPEDVQEAINEGADKLALYTELLDWIASKAVEDGPLCAFIAVAFKADADDTNG
jgi:hypothetical protein